MTPCVYYRFRFCFLIQTNGSKDNVERHKMQFVYVLLGSCYLQEEKLQIIKIFTTCVNVFFKLPEFPLGSVPTQESVPTLNMRAGSGSSTF